MIQDRQGTNAGVMSLSMREKSEFAIAAEGWTPRRAPMFNALWQRRDSICGHRWRSGGSFKLGLMEFFRFILLSK